MLVDGKGAALCYAVLSCAALICAARPHARRTDQYRTDTTRHTLYTTRHTPHATTIEPFLGALAVFLSFSRRTIAVTFIHVSFVSFVSSHSSHSFARSSFSILPPPTHTHTSILYSFPTAVVTRVQCKERVRRTAPLVLPGEDVSLSLLSALCCSGCSVAVRAPLFLFSVCILSPAPPLLRLFVSIPLMAGYAALWRCSSPSPSDPFPLQYSLMSPAHRIPKKIPLGDGRPPPPPTPTTAVNT
jgi:hypothetical protein